MPKLPCALRNLGKIHEEHTRTCVGINHADKLVIELDAQKEIEVKSENVSVSGIIRRTRRRSRGPYV